MGCEKSWFREEGIIDFLNQRVRGPEQGKNLTQYVGEEESYNDAAGIVKRRSRA